MRVLVTGIEGFVGSHLAEHLLTIPGVEVHGTVLDPLNTPNIDPIKPSLTLHPLDVTQSDAVARVFHDLRPERVLHLAGQAFVPASLQDPAATFRSNILGGVSVLEAARKNLQEFGSGPSVLIVSTGEVYGRVDPDKQPIGEDTPLRPNNPYAASKASIDLIAQQYHLSFGVDVVIARPFNHAGPRQSPVFVCSDFAMQVAEIAAQKRSPQMHVGNLEARRDFTDVRDVVRAYWQLFTRNTPVSVFNVCSGKALQIRTVLATLQEIAGVKVEIVAEETRLRSYDVPVVVGNNERLKHATGWSPIIGFHQTLQDTYQYWLERVTSGA